jgi:L-ascorbate metabolism protein UlaG (beta-lactamase superfamily)
MNTSTLVRKLSWAGIRVEAGDQHLVIDALEGRTGEVQARIGPSRLPLLPIADQPLDVALVTHTHKDHFDADALRRHLRPDAPLVGPAGAADELRALGHPVIPLENGERATVGRFTFTALPAMDGFGARQSSWLVEAPGVRLVHFGDTLFHGYWWEIAKLVREPDVVFLPINGARVSVPGQDATGLPGVMTAEQAAVAARIVKAKLAVPIHYAEFHAPPVYQADLNAEATFIDHAARQGVPTRIVAAGEVAYAA